MFECITLYCCRPGRNWQNLYIHILSLSLWIPNCSSARSPPYPGEKSRCSCSPLRTIKKYHIVCKLISTGSASYFVFVFFYFIRLFLCCTSCLFKLFFVQYICTLFCMCVGVFFYRYLTLRCDFLLETVLKQYIIRQNYSS